MALSYKAENDTSEAIAVRKYTHKSKNKIVYYTDNPELKPITKDDITVEHLEIMFGKTKTRYPKHHDALKHELLEKLTDDISKSRPMQVMRINDKSHFFPLPNALDETRQFWYFAGRAGSGKSTTARKLASIYMHFGIPQERIILICNKDDPEYGKIATFRSIHDFVEIDKDNDYEKKMDLYKEKKIKFKHKKQKYSPEERIELEFLIEKLKPEKSKEKGFRISKTFKEFTKDKEPSLFIFDDIEAMNDKESKKAWWLANYIGVSERKANVNVIFLSHQLTKSHITRDVLNEASHYVLFKTTQAKQLSYFSREYLKYPRHDTDRLLKSHKNLSRYGYLVINKLQNSVITEKEIYLL